MLDVAPAGRVHVVPEYAASLYRDPFAHRHIMVGRDSQTDVAVMVFGTSAYTQCAFGAPCFALDVAPNGPPNGGVEHLTHFNCAAIRRVPLARLGNPRGVLPPDYLWALRRRISAGMSTSGRATSGAGERGAIARLTKVGHDYFHTEYAVILTTAAYAAREQEHVVVPIYDMRLTTVQELPSDWLRFPALWGKQITGHLGSVEFAGSPADVASVRTTDHIAQVFPQRLTTAQLDLITDGVARFLGLHHGAQADENGVYLAACPHQ
ncbi:MAG: hypothetical protein K2R93_14470 [Gemmatimonadaceae bacterium]|nr:hypothetical protein [Gemmatimonadaceae bacterium]